MSEAFVYPPSLGKPLGHRAYGHIPHLRGSRVGPGDHKIDDGQAKIATVEKRDKFDEIIVQEKVDGSNVAVAKINGGLFPLGRAGYHAFTSPYELHHFFAKWVEENKQRFHLLLNEGERIAGEWLVQAHGTRYELAHEPFVVFDLMVQHERINYRDFVGRVVEYGFIIPRLIHIGDVMSVQTVLGRLEPSGHGAIDPVEGAVWRVERKGKVDFLCKYVRPDKIDGCYLPEESGKDPVWNCDPSKWQKK